MDGALLYEVIRRQLNLVWQIFRADICYQMSEAQIFPSRKQGTLIFFFPFCGSVLSVSVSFSRISFWKNSILREKIINREASN